MAEKENQHFVPQFYLRNFSYNNNGKQIGVYNLSSDKMIPTASLKHQASKSYYYGKDGKIENKLGRIESRLAPFIKSIVADALFPKRDSEDRFRLLSFLLLSDLRNPAASEKMIENERQLIQSISKMPGDTSEYQEETPKDEIILWALEHTKQAMFYTADLSMKILKNPTSVPFICSDNPVIKYNQFLEQRRWPGGVTGYGCRGLQMILPLDDKTAVIFYDDWVYRVGNKKDVFVSVNKRDVEQLNVLQFLNGRQNVFFNHRANSDHLRIWHRKSLNYDKPNKPSTKEYFNRIGEDGKETSKLIMQTASSCKTNMQLSFIVQTNNAKNHVFDNRAVQLRKMPFTLMSLRKR